MNSGALISGEPASPAQLSVGDLGFVLTEAGLGPVTWHGVELLRGVTFPVRDADWGTANAAPTDETVEISQQTITLRRKFNVFDGAIGGTLDLIARAEGQLELRIAFKVNQKVRVCRAGFTLLHPIVGLAGERLAVTHMDGSVEQTYFPRTVSPDQPVKDIAGLGYAINGCEIAITLTGDTFEMEDQRNWSDASYKTYCRPLTLPYPYLLKAGETISQSVLIDMSGRPVRAVATGEGHRETLVSPRLIGEATPSVALALEPDWAAALPQNTAAIPAVVRVNLNAGDALFGGLHGPLDLEVIAADDVHAARAQLEALARSVADAGLEVGHIIALPQAYLKSYQPDAEWPDGASPADLIAAARQAFPRAKVGGGMLTNFTELNRCRPDTARIDFLTHGSSAIVHAADSASVFQTLEALPQIFDSARALAPDLPYRLGLVSIGMRTNPYGAGLADNPDGALRTMTADDPRARTREGAAWMVGAMAATQGFAVKRIVLAATRGPFGILESDGRARPAYHVVRRLGEMAGLPRTHGVREAPIVVVSAIDSTGIKAVAANIHPGSATLGIPAGTTTAVLSAATEIDAADPDWLDRAEAPRAPGPLVLSAYDIAFLTIPLGSSRHDAQN